MPLYVYACSACSHQYERRHSVHEEADIRCPECLEFTIRRILQAVQITPSSMPTRMNSIPPKRVEEPSWEKGIAGEHRPDGSFAPFLRPEDQTLMGVKEFAENRRKHESKLRKIRSGTPA